MKRARHRLVSGRDSVKRGSSLRCGRPTAGLGDVTSVLSCPRVHAADGTKETSSKFEQGEKVRSHGRGSSSTVAPREWREETGGGKTRSQSAYSLHKMGLVRGGYPRRRRAATKASRPITIQTALPLPERLPALQVEQPSSPGATEAGGTGVLPADPASPAFPPVPADPPIPPVPAVPPEPASPPAPAEPSSPPVPAVPPVPASPPAPAEPPIPPAPPVPPVPERSKGGVVANTRANRCCRRGCALISYVHAYE